MYNETLEVFQETVEKLKERENDIKNRLKQDEIHLEEIIDPEFMKTYTSFDSFHEFISQSKLFPEYQKIMTKEQLEKINLKKFDIYIQKNTPFKNWKDFFHVALEEFIKKTLGLQSI
ncbi:MAG: hypothetical protein KKC68_06500 [Candidatus Thermoplasmatota archaeon]|nr:hypothetical protein [Candidatus Thermoplasmatota archaeon]MBU1941409.1 hypothetical protein [Candidatus Thermoplasmatota archaeon]